MHDLKSLRERVTKAEDDYIAKGLERARTYHAMVRAGQNDRSDSPETSARHAAFLAEDRAGYELFEARKDLARAVEEMHSAEDQPA